MGRAEFLRVLGVVIWLFRLPLLLFLFVIVLGYLANLTGTQVYTDISRRGGYWHIGMVNGVWHASVHPEENTPTLAESGWTNYPPLESFNISVNEIFYSSRVSIFTDKGSKGGISLFHFGTSEDSIEFPLWLGGLLAVMLWLPIEIVFSLWRKGRKLQLHDKIDA